MEPYIADIFFLILTREDGSEMVYSNEDNIPVGFSSSHAAMTEGEEIVNQGAATSHAAINLQAMIAHAKRWIERDK